MDKKARFRVVAADVIEDGLLVHFSNQTTVLFQADFLYDCRAQHDSVLLQEDGDGIPGK